MKDKQSKKQILILTIGIINFSNLLMLYIYKYVTIFGFDKWHKEMFLCLVSINKMTCTSNLISLCHKKKIGQLLDISPFSYSRLNIISKLTKKWGIIFFIDQGIIMYKRWNKSSPSTNAYYEFSRFHLKTLKEKPPGKLEILFFFSSKSHLLSDGIFRIEAILFCNI